MKKEEFIQEFQNKLKQLPLELSMGKLEQFYQYMQLLLEWNQKMNLTAITEPKEVILKHFIDSLTVYQYIQKEDRVLDIGTGAGFPGIPLKIANQENEITLLDSLNKRIIFLQEVIQKLNLKGIEAIHGRAEEFIKQGTNKQRKREYKNFARKDQVIQQQERNISQVEIRESYNVVTSRAVARLNTLLEYMLPFTEVSGKCICMKALNIEEEIKEAEKAIQILGGKIEKVDTIMLPDSDIERNIIIIKKIKQTPKQYPRKAGTPTKEPII